jgi:hypothetical protein
MVRLLPRPLLANESNRFRVVAAFTEALRCAGSILRILHPRTQFKAHLIRSMRSDKPPEKLSKNCCKALIFESLLACTHDRPARKFGAVGKGLHISVE